MNKLTLRLKIKLFGSIFRVAAAAPLPFALFNSQNWGDFVMSKHCDPTGPALSPQMSCCMQCYMCPDCSRCNSLMREQMKCKECFLEGKRK